jgi:hypothetical protein
MSDLLSQQLGTGQSLQQPFPPTIASATTIAPTTRLTFVTGTAQLTTITPPTSGYCEIILIFTNASPGAFLTTGNIQRAITPTQNIPVFMCYDPSSAKWYIGDFAL